MKIKILFFLFLIILTVFSCTDVEPNQLVEDNIDRKEILIGWADHIIIPSLESYVDDLQAMSDAKDDFISFTTDENLVKLRKSYLDAYLSWQKVSMFDIGMAEQISLRNFTNIFPTDVDAIDNNIATENYNLSLPSNFDAQGFPALDYLLYGIANSNAEILSLLISKSYSKYLDDLINRLYELSVSVLEDWQGDYREIFVNNDGSSATASLDKVVNDFLFYYERFLRAGKIGIPAGVFSGSALSHTVEAPYSNIYSKQLFLEGFQAVEDFFNGNSYDGLTKVSSLRTYLEQVSEQNNTSDISNAILNQWDSAENIAVELSNSLKDQVETDNNLMLQTYDELQKAVILLKVDMMQALNIQVDYVDADGD